MISGQRNKLWIIGCGDIGRRVASLYQKQGIQTRATVHHKDSQQLCLDHKIDAIQINLDQGNSCFSVECSSHSILFYFIPPPKKGRLDLRLRYFLDRLKTPPKRILLISTTGVYGDCSGKWIDETQRVKPVADRAKRRLDAEQYLIHWCQKKNTEWVILRVPGIYALDRLPIARIRKNLPVLSINQSPFTNRIHADDLAMVCQIAMENSATNEIYNACDDQPSTMTEYFNAVAQYAGLSSPPQISLDEAKQVMSSGMLSYLKESRKISNKKMKEKLKIKLLYPTLKDTLKK